MKIFKKINRFFRKTCNAFSWFKFGFNNREFDYVYFFEVIRFKLSKMERYFRKNGYAMSHYSQARLCKLAIKYIDILVQDVDLFPIMVKFYDKYYPEIPDIIKGRRNVAIHMEEHRLKIYCRLTSIVDKRRKIYRTKLFKLLDKHLETLWD